MHEKAVVTDCDIRKASVSDAADVVYLTQRAYARPYREGTPVTFMDEDEQSLTREMDDGWNILIARHGGLAVGALRFRIEGESIHVAKLAVDPKYRNRGIGTALLREVEAACEKQGAREVLGEVLIDKGMVPFFSRIGYRKSADRTAGPWRFVVLSKEF